jgi:hypothetical protein
MLIVFRKMCILDNTTMEADFPYNLTLIFPPFVSIGPLGFPVVGAQRTITGTCDRKKFCCAPRVSYAMAIPKEPKYMNIRRSRTSGSRIHEAPFNQMFKP